MASGENLRLKAFIYHMKYQHLKKSKCLLLVFVRYLKCVQFKSQIIQTFKLQMLVFPSWEQMLLDINPLFNTEVNPIFSCDRMD